MLHLRYIPLGENSQGDKNLNFMSYLKKKSEYQSQIWSKKSLGIGLENIWSQKKSRYRSRKHLVSKKSLGIGLKNIWSQKKVSVSVSKIFGLEKKSQSRSRKFWSRKKVSVSVSMKFFGLVTQWCCWWMYLYLFLCLLCISYIFCISENLKTSCRSCAAGCLDDWAAAFPGAISSPRLKKTKAF